MLQWGTGLNRVYGDKVTYENLIDKLNESQEKEIARMYFGRGESTTQIAGNLYYSEAQVKRYLKKAIKE